MKRSNYKAYDVNLTPFASSMIDEIKGKLSAVIAFYNDSIIIKSGSIVNVSNNLFLFNTDQSIATNDIEKLIVGIDTTGSIFILSLVDYATSFSYDPLKKGWYNASGNRAIATISFGVYPYVGRQGRIIQYLRYADQKI